MQLEPNLPRFMFDKAHPKLLLFLPPSVTTRLGFKPEWSNSQEQAQTTRIHVRDATPANQGDVKPPEVKEMLKGFGSETRQSGSASSYPPQV